MLFLLDLELLAIDPGGHLRDVPFPHIDTGPGAHSVSVVADWLIGDVDCLLGESVCLSDTRLLEQPLKFRVSRQPAPQSFAPNAMMPSRILEQRTARDHLADGGQHDGSLLDTVCARPILALNICNNVLFALIEIDAYTPIFHCATSRA